MTGIKPDRRQVIRAGAWTVPAIAVATAAPAFAASVANLSTSTSVAPTRSQKVISGSITIKNTGTAPTSALTVTISIAAGVDPDAATHALAGFTVTSVTTTTVTFTAANQLAGASSIGPLAYSVTRKDNGLASTTTINIDPGGNGTPGGPFTYSI